MIQHQGAWQLLKERGRAGLLLDLIPQGEPLRRLIRRHGIAREDQYAAILGTVPLASPGNIRVKEPWRVYDVDYGP